MLLRLRSRQTLIKHLLPLLRPLVTPNPLMLQRPRLLNKLTLASRSRKPRRLWSKPRPRLRKPRGKLPKKLSRPKTRPSKRLRQPLLMPRIRLMLQPLLLTRLLSQYKLLQCRWHLSSHNSYLLLLFSNSQQSSRHQAARNRRARGSKIPPPLLLTKMTRRKRAHFRSLENKGRRRISEQIKSHRSYEKLQLGETGQTWPYAHAAAHRETIFDRLSKLFDLQVNNNCVMR